MPLTTVSPGMLDTTAQYYSFKNKIINAPMSMWQRATAATNVTLNGPGYTTVDRYFVYQNGSVGVQTAQVAASLSGFQYALRWGRPNGNATTGITVLGQVVETANIVDLQGHSVTFSFWARCGANFSAASSQIAVVVYTGTGTDQSSTLMVTGAWTGSATPINTTATLTTSWQRFTFTGTFGASVTQAGIYMNWTPVGTAGADDNVYITGVQLEKGSTVTSFDYRPYGTELQLCLRYCEVLYVTGASNNISIGGIYPTGGSTTDSATQTFWQVQKRVAPTLTFSAANTWALHAPGVLRNQASAISTTSSNIFGALLIVSANIGVAEARPVFLEGNSGQTGVITASAEF